MATEIVLPEMGEGVIEGTLSRWLVAVGDHVDQFAPIAEIETDKVTTEVVTEVAGTVLQTCVEVGSTIPVETVLALVGQPDEDVSVSRSSNGATPTETIVRRYTGRISPVVGRIAAEHDVNLNVVKGSGRDGRITKNDVMAYIEQRESQPLPETEPQPELQPISPPPAALPSPTLPPATPTRTAGDELVPLNAMRRAIATHMVHSKQTSPHVTTVFEFDFTAVAAHRAAHKADFQRDGAKLTYTVYIVAAIVAALKQHPMVNSTWTDEGVLLKRDINVGMAAAVADGLVVPVIKGADGMNLLGLARAINDLTERARNKQLTHADFKDGTFSLTNHGTTGSLFATPIINQPQCGILGIGKIEKRVKVIHDAIAIRPLAYASFTFDHRILDGATADAFVSTVKDYLEGYA